MEAREQSELRNLIDRHSRFFKDLVYLAHIFLNTQQYESAALCCQIASHFAWHNHTGSFASPELEEILLAIGRQSSALPEVTGRVRERAVAPGNPKHVLHVLTQAYPIGGHTRFVWRWISEDAGRTHSVFLTAQGQLEVPPPLKEAVASRAGEIHMSDPMTPSLLSGANALRQMLLNVDQVILHIHPHDVIPIIALSNRLTYPPVIFLNHADHVFWLGVDVSDVVASIRDSGLHLAQLRRGVPEERSLLLPIPMETKERTLSRLEAKRRLGLHEDSVMIVSVASPYKYSPIDEMNFPDVFAPLLEKYEMAVLVMVGPQNEREWQRGSPRIWGRIKIAGERQDVDVFYQAADIYVDSFPFPSLTSLLEAGVYGVPLVGFSTHPDEALVLRADSPGLGKGLIRARSVEGCRVAVSELIEDAELRSHLGRSAKEDILAVHSGLGWKSWLERAYLHAAAVMPKEPGGDGTGQEFVGKLDLELVRFHLRCGISRGLAAVVRDHGPSLRLLRRKIRLWSWISALRKDPAFAFELLSGGWLGRHTGWLLSHGRNWALRVKAAAASSASAFRPP